MVQAQRGVLLQGCVPAGWGGGRRGVWEEARGRAPPRRRQASAREPGRSCRPADDAGLGGRRDAPIKQFVLYLNDQRKKQGQGFVIEDLDDTTLLIQPGNEKFLEDKLEEFYEENYFQRPLREGEVAVGAAAKRRKR